MAKLLKISGRTLGILLEWCIILIILFAFLIRTSPVQTYLAKEAADYLSKELKAKVEVSSVDIVFIDRLAVNGLLIFDQQGDTLVSCKSLFATFDEINLGKKRFIVNKAEADQLFVHIQRDENGVSNHSFIRDYFVKNKKRKNKILYQIKSVALTNSRFKYDDNRNQPKDYGVDYWHISGSGINASVNNIQIKKDVITGDIETLKFREKSGFELKNLSAHANVSPRGIKLSSLEIRSEKSKIETDQLNMVSKNYTAFKYFVDSVSFDARIDKSSLSLEEVALFAHPLRGMKDQVRFSTIVKDKVKELKIKDFDLRYAKKTQVKGSINLSDYRELVEGDQPMELDYFMDYIYADFDEIETLKLPDRSDVDYLELDARIKRLGHLEAYDLKLKGKDDSFVVSAQRAKTDLGNASIENGVLFNKNKTRDTYLFACVGTNEFNLRLTELELGKIIENKDIGKVSGTFNLTGEIFSSKKIEFNVIQGNVERFDYLAYAYKNIKILEGTYRDQIFEGKIDVKDDYLDLVYDGMIDFKEQQKMIFTIDLADAFLDNINVSKKDSRMRSYFTVNISGKTANKMQGTVKMDGFVYNSEGKEINVPSITMTVKRTPAVDRFEINSSIGSAVVEGKVDLEHLINNFKYQFSHVFPALATQEKVRSRKGKNDRFTYDVKIANSDEFFAVFLPDVRIAPESKLNGHYYGDESHFKTFMESKFISYKGMKFHDFSINQIMDSNSISGTYHSSNFIYNDSLEFNDIYFTTNGGNNELTHNLTWGRSEKASRISWNTNIKNWDHYLFHLEPSFFYLKDHRWDIAHESNVMVKGDTINVDFFELTRGDQLITVNGQVSKERSHHLNYRIEDLEVAEISGFITSDYPMEGKLNAWGYLASPFTNLEYVGDASLINFYVNKNEVGDIYVQSEWDDPTNSVTARGDLIYKGNQTFDFDGHYYIEKAKDNLDFDLFFDYTDIQFTNAFMDPDVMSEIRGILSGTVHLSGTPLQPLLDGNVELQGGSVYVDILGVHFGVDGPIEVDEYGFYANSIPVFDEEGNAGSLVGSIFHDNFRDFNFDLQFDIENDAMNRDPLNPFRVLPLEKFLVMNSEYSPEELYYGKAYATGEANIFGYTDNLEITVNATSKPGTWVNIPMYGVGEIDDENNFIFFADKDGSADTVKADPKIDFSGVYLNLNFDVTPDAECKIIFNEELDDEIIANAHGDLSITLDNFGEVRMDGMLTVDKGMYNFAMGPVKQKFYIQEGGTINWTGDPYNATIDLQTYYKVFTNIADISQDQFAAGTGAHQEVQCFLNLNESLLKPEINFDIKAPQANDVARSLIDRITSDKDELNRQFFSLLLWKRFQPLSSTVYSDGSAAADLITNQINSMLSMVSEDYKLNVAYDSDQLTGDKQYEIGVSKGLLNDRLILTGSFGVENSATSTHQNTLIGDLYLEYLLNEAGTFRISIFNQSTDKTIIQEADLGRFTQGAGLSYKEDFNSAKDFKAMQTFFDFFRKKENKKYPVKRKKEQRPVPSNDSSSLSACNQEGLREE